MSLLLCGAAIFVLWHDIARIPPHELLKRVRTIPAGRIAAAAAATAVVYTVLIGYDWLAFKYVKETISFARVCFAALIAYAFGVNIGMANFAGAAARFRIYSKWGIEAKTIGQVVMLDVVSNWMGFLLTVGLAFVIIGPRIPHRLHIPLATARPIGWVFLAALAAYVLGSIVRREPLKIRSIEIPLLRSPIFAGQVLVGAVDFALTGVPLYFLLPDPRPGYGPFLGVYLLATFAAIVTHVPGGLGVLEIVLLWGLGPDLGYSATLAALIAYRVIFYLVPFALALPTFAGFELKQRTRAKRSASPA